MAKVTDASYPASAVLDSDDTVVVVASGAVRRAGLGTLQDWLTDVAWISLPLLNGWLNYPASIWGTPGYRRIGDDVQLRGLIYAGTGVPLFTLPAGYRPPTRVMLHSWAAGSTTGAIRVDIFPDGTGQLPLDAATTVNNWLSLQLSFSTRT